MASVVMLIRGALASALAFTSSSCLFSRLSKDSIDKKRKLTLLVNREITKSLNRMGTEKTRANQLYQQVTQVGAKSRNQITELNDAMREYHEVFGHELPPLPQEPVLSDYYTPSNEQHDRELAFVTLSMIGIGGVLWYLED